ncbi:MAG: PIN domain-containing protein [Ardenticatenales bacterium]|nr:PIN domain-containing protein [Ardenticatenales bacterium]
MIFLDTHVVVWLYKDADAMIPAPVRAMLDEQDLVVSPIVELEIQYLFEIGRLNQPAAAVLAYLADRIGLRVDAAAFEDVARAAVEQAWTRDPFDRLIVAQAALNQRPLITKDDAIRAQYAHAFWQDA